MAVRRTSKIRKRCENHAGKLYIYLSGLSQNKPSRPTRPPHDENDNDNENETDNEKGNENENKREMDSVEEEENVKGKGQGWTTAG